MIELILFYKIGFFFILSKFLVLSILNSEEEIFQKISPWRKNQVIEFAPCGFSRIFTINDEPI